MSKSFRTGSILYHYLFYYFSIALLSCAMIGIFFTNLFLNKLEQADLLANQRKMDIAVKNIENQLQILNNISIKISSDIKYRPLHFQRNKYYEMELLEDFKKYIGYSILSEEYFLLYNDSDLVYLSSEKSSLYDAYSREILQISDVESFHKQLSNITKFTVLFSDNRRYIFFAYPITATSAKNAQRNATLCFVTDKNAFQKCITDITGGLEGKLELLVGETRVGLWESAIKTGNQFLSAYSPDGLVSMNLVLPRYSIYERINGLRWINLVTIIILIFLILSIAALFAYKNFKPIKQINSRINKREKVPEVGNEIENIGNICAAIIENNIQANKHLAEQIRMIREQSLRLMLSGNCSDNMLEQLKLQGVLFEKDYFAVFLLIFPDCMEEYLDKNVTELFGLIEDLSGDEIHLYTVKERLRNRIAIVANLKDDSISDVREMIISVLESKNLHAVIGCSEVYNSILNLPTAYMESIAECEEKNTRKSDEYSEMNAANNPLYYDPKYIARVLREVRAGNYKAAKEHLDSFTMELWERTHSLLIQRYIYSDILITLVKTGRELNVTISQYQINTALTAQDVYEFQNSVAAILREICSKVGSSETDDPEIPSKVLEYIKLHFMEYDLSLDKLSQEFKFSANYLCKLIKEEAGENYKDYVIQLKIEQAKKLLKEGYSVADTCEQIGYANISHFIKTFKKELGVTPSGYKKQHTMGTDYSVV